LRIPVVAIFWLLAATAPFAAAKVAVAQESVVNRETPVSIGVDDVERMGVAVQVLTEQTANGSVPAFVRAVDIVPLLALDSDLRATETSVAASRSELARLTTLAAEDDGASARAVEAAKAVAAADEATLELLRRRLRLEWSPALASRVEASTAFVRSLARGDTALVRADAPGYPDGVLGEVAIQVHPESVPLIARPIGLAGAADARMQTIGLYALVDGDGAVVVKPGRVFNGEIRTSEVFEGVIVPRGAVVRSDGTGWVYVRLAPTTFERRPLGPSRLVAQGWLVTQTLAAGDALVVTGAESLLAVETAQHAGDPD